MRYDGHEDEDDEDDLKRHTFGSERIASCCIRNAFTAHHGHYRMVFMSWSWTLGFGVSTLYAS